ncbi:MAG: cobyrinate a,c-diamide synthase [Terriglobia bacterium]|nr:cobyrinate a,c-diamide synthase [Terriglobia bacterium]
MKIVNSHPLPRLMVAGLTGGSGKTLVSMSLLIAARRSGVPVCGFKKGPDYIDSNWLSWASRCRARNLDSYLMGFDRAAASFEATACGGFNLVEGNRGVFDGLDAVGTHSSAALAKRLQLPVILVLNVTKVTRSAAAFVLGARALDPELNIAGIVLNNLNGRRHERVVRDAIASACDIPVVGAVPRLDISELVPERHLGLVTPEEFPVLSALEHQLGEIASHNVDLDAILRIAATAPPLTITPLPETTCRCGSGLKIAYIKDRAFSFYYAENLEAIERSGAQLVEISALSNSELPPDINALYVGGGFPETQAVTLRANESFLRSLRNAAERGLPIYAECGGLMLLSHSILWKGKSFPMANVFPFDVQVQSTKQGHGYTELQVDHPNPFFEMGTSLRGHEFHYSHVVLEGTVPATACAVRRGTGIGNNRDGLITKNVFGSYTHLHSLATPEWANGLLKAARRYADSHATLAVVSEKA